MSDTEFEPIGIFPALPTPIASDGSINYGALEEHIQYVEDGGVHGVVPAGCTGHAATLGDRGSDMFEEHVEFISRVAEMTDLPIIAGDGLNSTRQTIELAKKVEKEADITAHLMISPYQNCPPQDRIVEHYRKIGEEIEKPIIVYNVPSRTGLNMEPETTLEIAEEVDRALGIKEASNNYEQVREIGKALELRDLESFYLGSGVDSANDFIFEQGGTFSISVSANVYPEGVVDVWQAGFEKNDFVGAYELNRDLGDLHNAMFQKGEKNPMSVQYALKLLGFDYGVPRPPLDREPLPENRREIEEVLEDLDLI